MLLQFSKPEIINSLKNLNHSLTCFIAASHFVVIYCSGAQVQGVNICVDSRGMDSGEGWTSWLPTWVLPKSFPSPGAVTAPVTATSLGPVPSLAVLDCPDEAVCPTPRLGVPCRGGVPAGPSPPAALRPAAFTAHTHASPSHQASLTDSEIKLLRIQDSDRIP